MVKAAQAMSAGDFKGAMDVFQGLIDSEPENPIGHYGWAEAAFMRLSIDMEEDVPAGKIMQVYKKAMALDEDNLEYVASFANFCLDCGRIPMAIKEYQRLEKMADLAEIPVEDTLFDASRLIVDAIERVGQGRDEPMISAMVETSPCLGSRWPRLQCRRCHRHPIERVRGHHG